MTFDEYSALAAVTAPDVSWRDAILNAVLGMEGESGEVCDLVKKHLFQGHELDDDRVKEELGDTLWYIDAMARANGFTLEEVALANIEKLQARYPDGRFDSERSRNRGA